jgi:glycogen debranching enzyme
VEKSSGGSGGLTDVHKRLTEGAEHAREGVVKPSTPMVAEAATSLTSHIKQMLRLGPEKELSEYRATRDLHKLIEQVKSREHDIEGANASEVTRTLQAVDRLVTAEQLAVPLSRPERLAVAKQILFEAANPKSMPTGTRETSPVLAMEQSMSYWNPGRYAESVVSVLTTGKYKSPGTNPVEIDLSPHLMAKAPKEYRNALAPDAVSRQGLIAALKDGYQPGRDHTYAGQINELLGMNLLSQTNPNSKQFYLRSDAGAKMFEMDARSGRLRESEQPVFDVEPGHLMRIFDLKTGVHKPELALKKPIGSHFGIVDRTGNMKIIANDTVWAELGTQIDGKSLTLTGKANHNYMGSLELTNAQGLKVHADLLPTEHGFSKQVRIENTTDKAVTVTVAENFKPRVEDIFTGERGWVEPEPLPARRQQTEINPNNSVTLTYTQTEKPPQYKLDGGPQINYELQLAASSARDGQGTATRPEVSAKGAEYKITIGPGEAHQYQVDVRTAVNRPISELGDVVPFTTARTVAQQQFKDWIDGGTQVRLQGASASTIFSRAQGDIATLMIPTEHGPILAAGIPDFVTIFGRDSKTASQQTLAYNAKITEANLRADAALQGKIHDEYSAQLPGKMVHEVREGPLAKTLVQQPDGSYHSALPFARYYGSVDSTPMFLKLIGRYVDQTGNMQVVRDLYPNIQKALELMDFEVQRGGGYLRYGGRGNEALSNQGWKDSGISIKHANDQLAKAPIALAEPQGYLYEGWMQIAKVERLLAEQSPENAARHLKRAQELEAKAQDLSQRFQRDFWMPEKEFIALALDGTGKQADVVTSNPGHLLATGILSPENAKLVAERMVAPDMSSGYGIRTMASSELPYFANSYHNGPVWLHDFWYWADGAHKVIPEQAAKLSGEAVAAVHHFPDQRVPELWGGYSRSEHGIPIPYPRANSPQAWSGGAVLGLLASNLGLQPQAWANNFNGSLRIYKPMIPEGFGNVVEFNNYRVGDKVVSLRFTGNAQGSANVEVTSNPGNLPIEVVPHNKGE